MVTGHGEGTVMMIQRRCEQTGVINVLTHSTVTTGVITSCMFQCC